MLGTGLLVHLSSSFLKWSLNLKDLVSHYNLYLFVCAHKHCAMCVHRREDCLLDYFSLFTTFGSGIELGSASLVVSVFPSQDPLTSSFFHFLVLSLDSWSSLRCYLLLRSLASSGMQIRGGGLVLCTAESPVITGPLGKQQELNKCLWDA